MKNEYDVKVIGGHVEANGELSRCSHPGVVVLHSPGNQNYELTFPDDFKLIAISTAPLSPNQQVSVYAPSPTAGYSQTNTARLGVQTPIGTNAEGAFDFTAVGY